MPNPAFELDTSKFDRQLDRLSKLSSRSDEEQLTFNARDMLKSIVYNSPRDTGAMNAGWTNAWHVLGLAGKPNTRRSLAAFKRKSGRTYVPTGSVVDGRKARLQKYVTFTNRTHYRDARGRRVDYPFIVATRIPFMRRAEREIFSKFERRIAQQERKNARRTGF